MFARVSTLTVPSEQQEQATQAFRDSMSQLRGMSGNRGGILLVDRNGGRGVSLTLWESEQAMAESRAGANQLRQQVASGAGGNIQAVEEYEIAIWEVEA